MAQTFALTSATVQQNAPAGVLVGSVVLASDTGSVTEGIGFGTAGPGAFGAFALTADTDIITADGGVQGSPEPSFATLTAEVLDYLDRPELSEKVPMWIRTFQSKLNRVLRVSGLEAAASLVPSQITGGAPLPADYQAWRAVQSQAGGWTQDLEYATPTILAQRAPWPVGGTPRLFTIKGQMLFPAPSGPVLLTYYRGVKGYLTGILNDWVLLNHFDVYLYGVLAEAEKYLKNDERAATWEAQMSTSLNDLIMADRDARWGRARIKMAGWTP